MLENFKSLLVENKKIANDNEVNIIVAFIGASKELNSDSNFPLKAKAHLENLVNNLQNINMDLLPIESQAKIERLLKKEIPEATRIYFSLPKAHAVSVVLENGKTAKETLVEQFMEYAKRVESLWQQAVENQTKMLLEQEKIKYKSQEPKKDFFDL